MVDIRIEFVPLEKLKPHEEFTEGRIGQVMREIKEYGELWFPILVDARDYVILDGHHRTEAFRRMGYEKIPARLVDYNDPTIKVESRRPEIEITKDIVRKKAVLGEVFPHKTTRHTYKLATKHFDFALKDIPKKK